MLVKGAPGAQAIPRELGQYDSCWCPGSLHPQVINSHGINYGIHGVFHEEGPWGSATRLLINDLWKFTFVFSQSNSVYNGLIQQLTSHWWWYLSPGDIRNMPILPVAVRVLEHSINTAWGRWYQSMILRALTHCGLVTPYGNIDLGQHWFR